MIDRLVIFGATGDLARRYLFPALAAMQAAGRLPRPFALIGSARETMSDAAFRDEVTDALATHAGELPPGSHRALVESAHFVAADVTDGVDVRRAIGRGVNRAVAAYLALPPALFAGAVRAFAGAEPPTGSRIAIEKPFGTDLDEARALNALLDELFGANAERTVFRVDHVLGMATVRNLIAMRVANRPLDTLWNSHAVERVELLWEEVLGLEGRAGYFDTAGTLKDVVQNHLLQLLALVAMEPPAALNEPELRDAKVRALSAVRSEGTATRRARYTSGTLAGSVSEAPRPVPAYTAEAGVDPARGTETFAELGLEVDTPRWRGSRFVLRAGKALAERRKGIRLRFRDRSAASAAADAGSSLWIGIDGPNDITLRLAGGSDAGGSDPTAPVLLHASPPVAALPPYGNVLADLLQGGSGLSVRGDEAEAAWRIVMPVLRAWKDGLVPMEEYAAGAAGPAARA